MTTKRLRKRGLRNRILSWMYWAIKRFAYRSKFNLRIFICWLISLLHTVLIRLTCKIRFSKVTIRVAFGSEADKGGFGTARARPGLLSRAGQRNAGLLFISTLERTRFYSYCVHLWQTPTRRLGWVSGRHVCSSILGSWVRFSLPLRFLLPFNRRSLAI